MAGTHVHIPKESIMVFCSDETAVKGYTEDCISFSVNGMISHGPVMTGCAHDGQTFVKVAGEVIDGGNSHLLVSVYVSILAITGHYPCPSFVVVVRMHDVNSLLSTCIIAVDQQKDTQQEEEVFWLLHIRWVLFIPVFSFSS